MARTDRPAADGIAVTVLAGIDRADTALLSAGVLTRVERCATIWVDPASVDAGFVTCTIDDSEGRHATRRVDIVDLCVSCAMRNAVLQALRELADAGTCDTAIVELHPGIEPDAAVEGLCAGLPRQRAHIDTVVTVLSADTWLADLSGDAELPERGLGIGAGDTRSLASVIGSQLDIADRIVLAGGPRTALIPVETSTALHALSPTARRINPATLLDVAPAHVLATGAHDPRCLHPLTDRGLLDWTAPTESAGSLGVIRWWRGDRPLHPQRLYDGLERLADGVVRSSGRLWLAHATDTAIRWDSCGETLHLGPAAAWHTRGLAPGNRLAFLGHDLDRPAITAVLDDCTLTDAEMRAAPAAWAELEHPFPDWRYPDASPHDPPAGPR